MAVTKTPPLAALLDTIRAAAPGLRDAGVLSVSVGDVGFILAPGAAPTAQPPAPKVEPDPVLGDLDDAFGDRRARGAS